jgi:hypothetical protein
MSFRRPLTHPLPLTGERSMKKADFVKSRACPHVLSAAMMSPNSSQESSLKRESWTAWIG